MTTTEAVASQAVAMLDSEIARLEKQAHATAQTIEGVGQRLEDLEDSLYNTKERLYEFRRARDLLKTPIVRVPDHGTDQGAG